MKDGDKVEEFCIVVEGKDAELRVDDALYEIAEAAAECEGPATCWAWKEPAWPSGENPSLPLRWLTYGLSDRLLGDRRRIIDEKEGSCQSTEGQT